MIRKVLVYTFGKQSHKAAIKVAAQFSVQHNAELIGLFVKPDIGRYSTIYGNYPLNLAYTYFETQNDYQEQAKTEFDKLTSRYDIATQWYGIDEYEKHANPALYVDMIFVCQPSQEGSVIFNDSDFIDHLITTTGIPIIVIPKNWASDTFAKKPVLAWKETREAVGAVRHTLPLMREATDVNIVSARKKADPDTELITGIKISEYLTEHGVCCRFSTEIMKNKDHDLAQTLLRHVDSHHRDLIIMGGYGHSRLREIILGGMTRALIKKSTVPVLLSH